MAKKKSRSLNIARRRTKRKQNQKSRRKQLAIQKQRRLQHEKSDEERLQEKILQSRLLLDEPEFESITFDPDLMRQNMLELLESSISSSLEDEENADDDSESTPEIREREEETIGEKFRIEILPRLITPDFIRRMSHALKACETRLRRTGHREKAEVALVARSLFELADAEALVFHPLILKISALTLERLLAQPQFMLEGRDTFQNVLSDVLSFNAEEDTELQKHADQEALTVGSEEISVGFSESPEDRVDEAEPVEAVPSVSPADFPAKALYKNFNGLETRQAIERENGYRIVKEADQQVEFVHPDLQRYITLTVDRLLLQCPSKPQLEVAMREVEEQCGQALFYLARAVDE